MSVIVHPQRGQDEQAPMQLVPQLEQVLVERPMVLQLQPFDTPPTPQLKGMIPSAVPLPLPGQVWRGKSGKEKNSSYMR